MTEINPFSAHEGGLVLAEAIVDTISEILVVLDRELRVLAASRSFYSTFKLTDIEVTGKSIFELAGGRLDVPPLRSLIEDVMGRESLLEGIELDLNLGENDPRVLLLNARTVHFELEHHKLVLLAMQDITAWRLAERSMRDLLRDKDMMLQKIQHRVASSLQVIASILLLKTRGVVTDEARQSLQEAHARVMAVADEHALDAGAAHGEPIEMAPYLESLATKLGLSMIHPAGSIAMRTELMPGHANPSDAVAIGLIATELIINAIKHAFPDPRKACEILVSYTVTLGGWTLIVADNGIGIAPAARPGLGTSIIEALTKRLAATLTRTSSALGTRIEIDCLGKLAQA